MAAIAVGAKFYTHILVTAGCDDAARQAAAAGRNTEEEGFACSQCGVSLFKKSQDDAKNHTIQEAIEAHLYEVRVGSPFVHAVLLPTCKSCNSSKEAKKGWFTLHPNCGERPQPLKNDAGVPRQRVGAKTFLQAPANVMDYPAFKSAGPDPSQAAEMLTARAAADRTFSIFTYGLKRAKSYLKGNDLEKREKWASRLNWVNAFLDGNDLPVINNIEAARDRLQRKICGR